jgi:acylphosphatase
VLEKVRAHLVIDGRVQGVCFRAEMEEEAMSRGVTGWVRNRPDGKVESVVEGEKRAVQGMIDWCHQGPSLARVEKIDVDWQPYRGDCPDFRIAH